MRASGTAADLEVQRHGRGHAGVVVVLPLAGGGPGGEPRAASVAGMVPGAPRVVSRESGRHRSDTRAHRGVGEAGVVRVARLGGLRPRGPAALAAVPGRPGAVARDRRAAPPDAVRGGPEPPLAGDAEEGPVHRAPDPGGGGHREDGRLHAPLRAPAPDLAGPRQGEAGGGALPGGQGRLLFRREEDAGRLRAVGRLHRAEHGAGRLRLEPARGALAGRQVDGRHDRLAHQPNRRGEGEGAVLAAGVYERSRSG